MNKMNNKTTRMESKKDVTENHNADFSRYLAYQEAVKSLRGNADGCR